MAGSSSRTGVLADQTPRLIAGQTTRCNDAEGTVVGGFPGRFPGEPDDVHVTGTRLDKGIAQADLDRGLGSQQQPYGRRTRQRQNGEFEDPDTARALAPNSGPVAFAPAPRRSKHEPPRRAAHRPRQAARFLRKTEHWRPSPRPHDRPRRPAQEAHSALGHRAPDHRQAIAPSRATRCSPGNPMAYSGDSSCMGYGDQNGDT